MEFQQDCPKDPKITDLSIFLAENLEKFRSTEHYGAALEGSTIFLCRSSLGSTAKEAVDYFRGEWLWVQAPSMVVGTPCRGP